MKRLIVKFLLVLCVMAGAANYLVYLRTGQSFFANWPHSVAAAWQGTPKLTPASLNLPTIPPLPNLLDTSAPRKTTAYKWVDKNGIVHYSDAAPAKSDQAKIITVNPDANMILGASEAAAVKPAKPKTLQATPATETLPTGAQDALQQAKGVDALMKGRNQQLDQSIEAAQ